MDRISYKTKYGKLTAQLVDIEESGLQGITLSFDGEPVTEVYVDEDSGVVIVHGFRKGTEATISRYAWNPDRISI